MRVLVIGASGVIGRPLISQLAERGHQVTGTSRSAARAGQLQALGAEPAVLDVLDERAVRAVVEQARPDAVIYQATALTGISFSRNMDRAFGPTNELRTKGTDILLAAVARAGVPKFIGQSFAPFRYAHIGGPVKDESDPLVADPGAVGAADVRRHGPQRRGGHRGGRHRAALRRLLRGRGRHGAAVRKRQFPLIGDGGGMMSFIHLEDAAAATVLALDAEGPAVYNVTDDEPAPMREWLPALAAALGAKPPFRVPRWVGPSSWGRCSR